MISSRKFSRSVLFYQMKNPKVQSIIKTNEKTRFFDAFPDTHCIYADTKDDEANLLPTLLLIPEDTIVMEDKGYMFSRQEDIDAITQWAKSVLEHAANIMLTEKNKINPQLRQLTGKTNTELSAHDILFAFMGTNAMQLQLNMYKHTMPDVIPSYVESDESTSKTPIHPFEKHFIAFTTLINTSSSEWINQLFEKRCPKPASDYTQMAIGIAIGGAILLFSGAAVAARCLNNDNSRPKSPPSSGHQ